MLIIFVLTIMFINCVEHVDCNDSIADNVEDIHQPTEGFVGIFSYL